MASFEITLQAMKAAGRDHYLPGFEIPHDAPAVVAFLMVVGSDLRKIVQEEGHSTTQEPIISAAGLLFVIHPDQEKIAVIKKGAELFDGLVRENLDKLVRLYVMHLLGENDKLRAEQFENLFGSMLQTILKAVES